MKFSIRIDHFTLISVLLCATSCCNAWPPANHIIKFVNLKHGYFNQNEAIDNLANNLRRITGYENITINEMNPDATTWHVDNISRLPGCPENDIRNLLARIKTTRNEYTRRFKMELTEYFLRPERVDIEWIGPCAHLAQTKKRDQIIGGPEEPKVQITTTVKPTSSSELATEPVAPTTTTEAPATYPSPQSMDAPTAATTTTEDPFSTSSFRSLSSMSDLDSPGFSVLSNPELSMLDDNVTQATTTTTTTTVASIAQDSAGAAGSIEIPSSDLPDNSTTTSTTETTTTPTTTTTTTSTTTTTVAGTSTFSTEPNLMMETLPKESSDKTDDFSSLSTTSLPPSDDDIIKISLSPSLGGAADMSKVVAVADENPADDRPHYGKYIGLTTAFLIFVAYLLCTRAFQRQGMYELAQNTAE